MNTRFLSIMGAKDRVGCSTFAFQLADTIKKRGENVLLLDWDAAHLGDLRLVSEDQISWRALKDLAKIPRPIQPNWLAGFLKGPLGIASLSLAPDRSQLSFLEPQNCLNQLRLIAPLFNWIIADLGSRWNPFNSVFLTKTDSLLFVLNPEISLVQEAKRKLEELSISFFPLKKIGWVGRLWDSHSFLKPSSVAEFLKIPCYGEDAEQCWQPLKDVVLSNGDLDSFLPENLFSYLGNKVFSNGDLKSDSLQVLPNEEETDLKVKLLELVQEKMELKGIKKEEAVRSKVGKIVLEVLDEKSGELPAKLDRTSLIEELLDELLALGPLERLFSNPNYSEILVNGTKPIYVEEAGKLKQTQLRFLNQDSLQKVIERILLPTGRRIDESSPMVDARLKCGSRVNMIIPPLALEGPIISIRRFSKKAIQPNDLIHLGTANEGILKFLEEAILNKLNILVSGGTGSGKTTLLNILSSFISDNERIITIEDAAELSLNQPHVVRLEARPPNIEGKGGITIRDLVRNALRMRPDRIVVGECRGAEALDMLSAMNTGHDGSLTSLHANSPRDALSRLETLVMFAGMELPSKAIREQIAGALDFIIQIARLPDGSRKILSISKLSGMETDAFTLEDVYVFENGEFKEGGL